MKYIKLLVLILLAFVLFLGGCQKEEEHQTEMDDPETVDKITMGVDFLPENITLKYLDKVLEYWDLYNKLSDYDKEQVYNYDILVAAFAQARELQDKMANIDAMFTETYNYINDNLPKVIATEVGKIDIVQSYKTSYDTIVDLVWDSSDAYTLSSSGYVTHKVYDVTVTLSASMTVRTLEGKQSITFDILVKKRELRDLSNKQIVAGYMSYTSMQLDEDELETVDIVNYAFSQIIKTTVSGETVFAISTPSVSNLSYLHDHGIRILLSLGGWQNDSSFWDTYRQAISTDETRKQVASAIYETMMKYNLDGIDMDWEYPTSADRDNFVLLMKEIREVFDANHCEDFLITAAIPAGSWSSQGYDFPKLEAYMDYYFLMTYDLDSGGVTRHHSALYTSTYAPVSVESSVRYLLNQGVNPKKIVIGAAFYGRICEGVNNTNNGLGQSYSKRSTISYTKIVSDYLSRLDTEVFKYYDSACHGYYLYDKVNKVFICYDAPETIIEKYNYAVDSGLGGLMFWSFNNNPTGELLEALHQVKPGE